MPVKSFYLSGDIIDALDKRKGESRSYEVLFRELLGMHALPVKKTIADHPDYTALVSLKLNESCQLKFERPEPIRDADGGIPASWDSRPTNLRHLSQVVRRAQEATGFQFFVEGRPMHQIVTRVR